MMVPRSFKYSSSPPRMQELDEKKSLHRNVPRFVLQEAEKRASLSRQPITRTATEPARMPSQAIPVPISERSHPVERPVKSTMRKEAAESEKKDSPAHDPNALPPAVAALLAVTQIPRPKLHQVRRRAGTQRRISIDELVQEWKNEELLSPSYSSSPALNILLEDTEDVGAQYGRSSESVPEGC